MDRLGKMLYLLQGLECIFDMELASLQILSDCSGYLLDDMDRPIAEFNNYEELINVLKKYKSGEI